MLGQLEHLHRLLVAVVRLALLKVSQIVCPNQLCLSFLFNKSPKKKTSIDSPFAFIKSRHHFKITLNMNSTLSDLFHRVFFVLKREVKRVRMCSEW